jgi:hypothetical protein
MGITKTIEAVQPASEDFRDLPIAEAFTWENGLPIGYHYLVNFLSLRNPDAPLPLVEELWTHDSEASEEAKRLPGYEHYFHDDVLSPELLGSSWCLWETQEAALYASHQSKHMAAVKFMRDNPTVYLDYAVNRYAVNYNGDSLKFEPVTDVRTVRVLDK